MADSPYRVLDHANDMEAVQRIWIECGWIDDDNDERRVVSDLFATGECEVGTIDNVAECAVQWVPGSMRYQDEALQLGAVTVVTTSHIARRLGFAGDLTARSIARQYKAGMDVSALGIFDQGFYDKLGYGTGPYETLTQFDPTKLNVDMPDRSPQRLTVDDYGHIHQCMSKRRMHHGGATLSSPENTKAELELTENHFGLGYFDGPDGSLSHFIWGEMKGEHGPYQIDLRAYQTDEQLLELLGLMKSLGDQVNSFKIMEFGEFQLQDLLDQPFRTERGNRGSKHQQHREAIAYWQLRIVNLENCLARTHLPGPTVRFNLQLADPLREMLADESTWQGLSGDYVITIGADSSAVAGSDGSLPTMQASINAFSRMWLGVRPASNIAITDELIAEPALIEALDHTLRLPRPHFGWDF